MLSPANAQVVLNVLLSMRILFAVLFTAGALAQSSPLAFEVASVKPREGPYGRIGISTAGLRLTAEATNLRGLVMYAYDVRNFQVASSPAMLAAGDTPYDIVAKAPDGAVPTTAEFREMMRSLLADRFQLKLHREMRDAPVYALVVGKSRPKFKESASDATAFNTERTNLPSQ